jgi:hypothetical protein
LEENSRGKSKLLQTVDITLTELSSNRLIGLCRKSLLERQYIMNPALTGQWIERHSCGDMPKRRTLFFVDDDTLCVRLYRRVGKQDVN